MKIAITGATGFIGNRLVKKLSEQGHNLRVLSRSNIKNADRADSVQVFQCDLLSATTSDLSAILKDVEVLYHCAGQLTNKNNMHALHVEGTRKLVNVASQNISHWVQLSSVGVYGPRKDGEITERSPIRPAGEYEITKAESDQIVIDSAKRNGFSYTILRPSNVFGGDMKNQSLFSMVSMIDKGLFFYIGRQGASANYIHVNNVVQALISCIASPIARNKIYNLSDYRTLEHFVAEIAKKLNRPNPSLRIPEEVARTLQKFLSSIPQFPLTESRVNALVNRSTYPIDFIKSEIGYNHLTTMEQGLEELILTYNNRKSHK